MNPNTRIAIVEDEPLYRSLLRTLLSGVSGFTVTADAGSVAAADRINPDLVDIGIIDIGLAEVQTGFDVARRWTRHNPHIAIVLLTNHAYPQLLDCITSEERHRWSYLLKSSVSDVHALVYAIRSARAGHSVMDPYLSTGTALRPGSLLARLTPQQLKVVRAVAAGQSNAQIAQEMYMSVKGVESLLRRTLPLLGVDTNNRKINPRVAATIAVLTGLVPESVQSISP